jgi:hypothetical protein
MLRKFVCASVVVVIGFGVAVADEFGAIITKVDNGKVTFKKIVKKGETAEETTLPLTADAKVTKGKINADTQKLEAGDPIADGLKSDTFTKIGDKGLRVTITTDADNKHITAITVRGAKKKAAE